LGLSLETPLVELKLGTSSRTLPLFLWSPQGVSAKLEVVSSGLSLETSPLLESTEYSKMIMLIISDIKKLCAAYLVWNALFHQKI